MGDLGDLGSAMRTAIILTALPVEAGCVLRHLSEVKREFVRGTVFHVGRFSGERGDWRVAVAELGAGNVPAAVAVERAAHRFAPDAALFVGVAGGIKDVTVGDVVVATKVYGYESGKVEDGGFRPRPALGRSSESLVQWARTLAHADDWRDRLRDRSRSGGRRIVMGPIAAGEKVVASVTSGLSRFLAEHYGDALAVEMEGYGFLEGLALVEEVRGLVIRGISDRLEGKSESDAAGGQELAADGAAAVAFELLSCFDDGRGARTRTADGPAEPPADGAPPFLGVPERVWKPERSPPGALLRAEYGVVPFHGRDAEVEDIEAWCGTGNAVGVRLYTGAGGMGKTRLFIELCRRMRAAGWTAGFVDHDRAPTDAEAWAGHLERLDRAFLVVDYAETRESIVEPLLAAAAARTDGAVRIVLLARTAGDWWDLLKGRGAGVGDLLSGPATRWHPLRPLALSAKERRYSYGQALENFRRKLGRPPIAPDTVDFSDRLFDRVLLLHMQALATIDGVAVKGEDGILDYVLRRERHYWEERAAALGLPATLVDGVSQAMAVLTLGGGAATRGAAIDTLGQVPLLADQPAHVLNAVAGLLHDAYPGERWIEPLMPDLLGEHLVEAELDRNADALFDLVFGPRDGDGGAAGA